MVPLVEQRIASNASGNPLCIGIVPDVPLVAAAGAALVAPGEAHVIEELVDVELQRLGRLQVTSPEIDVVGEVMQRGHDGMTGVGHALRGEVSDEVVVPEHVGVGHGATEVVLRCTAREGWGLDALIHRPSGSGSARSAVVAVRVAGGLLGVAAPSAMTLNVGEGLAASADVYGD